MKAFILALLGTASALDISQYWANLRPYHQAHSFGVPSGIPHCDLSQVHVLHRHAERYPTDYPLDGQGMQDFASKWANYSAKHPDTTPSGPLHFLAHWQYALGTDELMPTGAATEATSGAHFWTQYGRLLQNQTSKPVFRTTSQPRILESARWWLSGFFANTAANSSADLYDLVVIPETSGANNTLASYESCPGDTSDGYPGDNSAEVFLAQYTKPARARLAAHLPRGFNLTAQDILAMQNLCVYESIALSGSFFCSLFTEQEWKDFEYAVDLQYYGDYAYGSPSGRAQGIGYVLELAARLQHRFILSSDTSVNATLDNNPRQFPLDQPLYMDMSHDDIILSVITALGLDYFRFGPSGLPGNVSHAPNRTFSLSEMTPFGARLVSEIWTCPRNVSFKEDDLDPVLYQNHHVKRSHSPSVNTTEYIRFVLNGAPLPLEGLVGCERAQNGFCAVDRFLRGVPQLKRKAKYQDMCFGKYDGGTQVGDGVIPS